MAKRKPPSKAPPPDPVQLAVERQPFSFQRLVASLRHPLPERQRWRRLWWFLKAREYDRWPWFYGTWRITLNWTQWSLWPVMYAVVDFSPVEPNETQPNHVSSWRVNARLLCLDLRLHVTDNPKELEHEPPLLSYLITVVILYLLYGAYVV